MRKDNEVRITPSVLDRLLDFEPGVAKEAPKSRTKSLRELKLSVKRDLEWLLNTRRYIEEVPETLEETQRSLAVYGLPDIVGMSASNPAEQKRLIKEIEATVRKFEPRFLDIKVTLEPFDNNDRTFRFRIEARLNVEPTPEPITFDTALQFGSGAFVLKEK